MRVAGPDAPVAASFPLEQASVPSVERIVSAAVY
jgi:pyruvate/2-oxoglutarate/acetoin dehydrogenase E1 component